jgi:hypothetical protein
VIQTLQFCFHQIGVNPEYDYDSREFNSIQWFGFDEIPYDRADPHMQRFVNKLKGML